jgi:hypothetical protein
VYSLNAGASADNLLGGRHDGSGVNPFGTTIPRTEWPESNKPQRDVSKKPRVGRAYIELLGGRTCGPLV